MKYPNCEKVGLKVKEIKWENEIPGGAPIRGSEDYIRASDVEKLLSEGHVMYGDAGIPTTDNVWTNEKYHKNTHSGLLINYKPIEKPSPVTKEEVVAAIKHLLYKLSCGTETTEELKLIEELTAIKQHGVKP